jgi:hypothetical protein
MPSPGLACGYSDSEYVGLFGTISVTVRFRLLDSVQIDTEEDETVFELKRRCASLRGIDVYSKKQVTLLYRSKILRDEMTLKQEGLSGGELLTFHVGRVPVQDGDPR